LVDAHQQYAFALAFRILCDEDDARDVVQESFISIWKHILEYNPRNLFTTWMYRIVTNKAKDRLKANIRRENVMSRDVPAMNAASGSNMLDQELANKDLAERIRSLAENLPITQRLVFILRDIQDLSVPETAEALSISQGSVKTHLCHARAYLRRAITDIDTTTRGV
jgi:RNA polymerase sigma-70 factor (ECF subfamily)